MNQEEKKIPQNQIPDIIQYTANKKYNDLLYSKLQELSYTQSHINDNGEWNKIRYVNKMTYEEMGKEINVYRTTVSKCFKELVQLGLIDFDRDKKGKVTRYILVELPHDIASLIPTETLAKLNSNFHRYLVSIYVFLVKTYNSKKVDRQSFIVRMAAIKNFIGVSTSTSSNNEDIIDKLKILNTIGLIKWHYFNPKADQTDIYIDAVYDRMKLTEPEIIEALPREVEKQYVRAD